MDRKPLRKIIHVDMDAFFASVEQRDHPELRGKPVAVGHAGSRGVVAAASYEARQFGVHSAMASSQAKELCPNLIFVQSNMSHYKAVSDQVREIFSRYTDLIERISIDEAFLDVTHNKIGADLALDIAKRIKADIRRELHLVASAGVSYNKFLAKIASDYRKPDGLCVIHPDQAIRFIDRLPIEAFWGIGPATAKKLHAMGINTAPQLRAMSLTQLTELFGKAGLTYYNFVRGIDTRPVTVDRERKSVGCEETFRTDIRGIAIDQAMSEVIDELVRRLQKNHFAGCRLTLKVRFPDFTTVTRSMVVLEPLQTTEAITALARELLSRISLPPKGIRLLGLSVSKTEHERLLEAQDVQLTLF